MSWIKWKGDHSDSKQVVISVYPSIVRAEERIESIKIPGRSGELFLQTALAYEPYIKPCLCYVRPDVDISAVASWLTGAGDVVFGNEPDYAYEARIINSIPFDQIMRGRGHRTFEVPFYVQPFKKLAVTEADIIRTSQLAVSNPGTATSYPKIKVEGTGSITLMVGQNITTLTGMTEPIVLDTSAGIATDSTGTQNSSYLISGDWPELVPGSNAIGWTGNLTKLTITPKWRWL